MLVKTSFLACINFACASAKDDSDCATSEIVTCPLSSLIVSVSTCLSSKFTFALLISNFSFAKISPV